MPKLSIAIPVYDMKNRDYFLGRCLDSIKMQSFKDYEIVITENGKGMAGNTNEAIKQSKGELVKILFMDDFLSEKDSLKDIIDNFKDEDTWLVTGCEHYDGDSFFNPHYPTWSTAMGRGANTIGSPSVVTLRRGTVLLFDENLSWVLDCDLYVRYYEAFGLPKFLNTLNVVIGVGDHQATNMISNDAKKNEYDYLIKKNI